MLNGLDLFSGIGGISFALKDIVKPLAYVEIDSFCQKVLRKRMDEGNLHQGEVHGDVKEFKGEQYKGKIDIIYGGFPCQDISVAGNGKGLAGERSGLFYEIIRLTKEIRPSFIFLENVPAIRTRGLHQVIQEFTFLGYDCRWTIVSAKEVGASHIRKRWFMLAYSNSKRLRKKQRWAKKDHKLKGQIQPFNNGKAWDFAKSPERKFEPRVFRANDGIPCSLDRNRALGNAVVPVQTRKSFFKLFGLEKTEQIAGRDE